MMWAKGEQLEVSYLKICWHSSFFVFFFIVASFVFSFYTFAMSLYFYTRNARNKDVEILKLD